MAQQIPCRRPSKIPQLHQSTDSLQSQQQQSRSLLLAWQVRNKHCLVIGGGDVALSRIEHLIRANAKITVVTGDSRIHPEINRLNQSGKVFNLITRNYHSNDLTIYENLQLVNKDIDNITPQDYDEINNSVFNETFAIVCCCIDDYELSTKIYYQCKLLRLPVNIADKPHLCDYYFGSMINQDNLQIMISTNGKSPRLSRLIKDNIAKELQDVDFNQAIENLGMIRTRLREKVLENDDLVSIDARMTWIKTLTDFFSLKEWSELKLVPESSTPPFDNQFQYIDNIIGL
ncbi:Siroheme biosynthesis protein met8 [Spathaspora sp. JA1]|nr:Siroheme biosynthesis protein met8 [Spathaspora sp. JA1]